ncbi:MAG: YicC family protein [Deltaproteobacteria bacterium]|nr:YicC family protein [Deltaproteobacteria bacterium]
MTGFSSQKIETKDVRIEFNLKSVNGRFLESRFHLPKEYVFLEPELRKILNITFQRGTVDVFCHRKIKRNLSDAKIQGDMDLASKISIEISKLQKQLKLSPHVSIKDILSIAPVIQVHEETDISKAESQMVLKIFKEGVEKCHLERVREGHSIKKELLQLLNLLVLEVASVKKQRAINVVEVVQKWKDKLKSKAVELVEDQKVQQEIFFLAEKADIAEEIQRLEEHLKNYKNLLLSKKSEGKKIDFYTQELLREINTIGSKSQSAKITQHVVEAKGLIEKLKEQAQNIE